MALRKDEYGFLRSGSFGSTTQPDLREQLGAVPGDEVYHSSAHGGVRTSSPVNEGQVNYRPGDTFAVGPKVTKAALPHELHEEWQALQRGGYGQIGAPQ